MEKDNGDDTNGDGEERGGGVLTLRDEGTSADSAPLHVESSTAKLENISWSKASENDSITQECGHQIDEFFTQPTNET